MTLTNSNHLKYRAYIDGLRAIAVLAVLFFHADIGFHGGYVGVDVFFVISGYLITRIILEDLDNGRFQIIEFWERRVRRILPALAVVVLACLVAGWFLFFPLDFGQLGQSVLAQAMLVSNVHFYLESGYFSPAAEVKPLLHTWSLAVEEQFYLLFPFLLIAFQHFSRKSLVPAILLLCVVSFGLCVYLSYTHALACFYLLPTRAWELLIGSFLAAIPAQRTSPRWVTESFSCGGLLAILGAVFFYDRHTRFPGVAALLPCVGAALVIWANGHTLTSVGRLLAAPPMVFIGLISYSLYLWHWPVLVFFKYWAIDPIPTSQRLLLLLASLVMAALSWKFVEMPFRKRIAAKSRSRIFTFAGVTTAVLFFAALAVYKLQGLPSRLPPDALAYATYMNGKTIHAFRIELSLNQALNGDFVELGIGDKHLPIGLFVWGDSHAMAVNPVLDILCKEHSFRGVAATHSATAPLVGYEDRSEFGLKGDSIAFNDAVVEFIRRKHVNNVVLAARWDYYIDIDKGTNRLRSGVLATINALHDSGARIWIMRQVPKHRWNVPQALVSAAWHGGSPEELGCSLAEHLQEIKRQDPIFEGFGAKFSSVTVLDPTDLFVNASGRCRVAEGGKPLYMDKDHLTVVGAMLLQPLFEPIFADMNKGPAPIRDKGISH